MTNMGGADLVVSSIGTGNEKHIITVFHSALYLNLSLWQIAKPNL